MFTNRSSSEGRASSSAYQNASWLTGVTSQWHSNLAPAHHLTSVDLKKLAAFNNVSWGFPHQSTVAKSLFGVKDGRHEVSVYKLRKAAVSSVSDRDVTATAVGSHKRCSLSTRLTSALQIIGYRRHSCMARIHVPQSCTVMSLPALSPSRCVNTASELVSFDVKHQLGAGGFGSVHLGVINSRKVALKQIHARISQSLAAEESFRAEQLMRRLRHPNVVQVLGALTHNDVTYMVMEYTGSMNLQQRLNESDGPLPLNCRLSYSLDLSAALDFIHKNQLVHLDLKPANVMITPYDTCKLGDFGCCQVFPKLFRIPKKS